MRFLILAIAMTGLTACETTMDAPQQRTAKAQADFDRALAGRTAGAPMNCLPTWRSRDMTVIDDSTILFREGRTTYVNKPLGACNGLGWGGRALVTRSIGPQLCRGDIATVVDTSSGFTVGSCSLGDFVPYRPGMTAQRL